MLKPLTLSPWTHPDKYDIIEHPMMREQLLTMVRISPTLMTAINNIRTVIFWKLPQITPEFAFKCEKCGKEFDDDPAKMEGDNDDEEQAIGEEPPQPPFAPKGPGGHTPDGTGPYGRGQGPGKGRGDGSGMAKGRIYVNDPSKAPDGATVIQGKKGGYYYEASGDGGGMEEGGEKTRSRGKELFRAADKPDIKEGACFTEQLEHAEAYTEDVGFGGGNLWRTEVEPENPLYLKGDGRAELSEILGLDHVDYAYGYEIIDEPKYREQLRDKGYDWVQYEEPTPGSPSDVTRTWVYLGGDEPQLKPLTPIKEPEKEKSIEDMDDDEKEKLIDDLQEEVEDDGLDPDDYYDKDKNKYIQNLQNALNKSIRLTKISLVLSSPSYTPPQHPKSMDNKEASQEEDKGDEQDDEQADKHVCDECGGPLVEPDENQKDRLELFIERANLFKRSLWQELKMFENDLNIFDDAYLIFCNYYAVSGEGKILVQDLKEVIRASPLVIRMVRDPRGRVFDNPDLKAEHRPELGWWTCVVHRFRDDRGITSNLERAPGKCKVCNAELVPVHYVALKARTRDRTPDIGYIENEVIHISKYLESEFYGTSPVFTAWTLVKTDLGMDSTRCYLFTKARPPKGLLTFNTRNTESVKAMWETEMKMVEKDPYHLVTMCVDTEGKGQPVTYTPLTPDMAELNIIEHKKDIRNEIGAIFQIPPSMMGDMKTTGGMNQEKMQLTMEMIFVAERAHSQYYHPILFPKICEALEITDWKIEFPRSIEADKNMEAARRGMNADVATKWLNMGANVQIVGEKDAEIKITEPKNGLKKQKEKPNPFGGGGAPPFGGGPPQAGGGMGKLPGAPTEKLVSGGGAGVQQ